MNEEIQKRMLVVEREKQELFAQVKSQFESLKTLQNQLATASVLANTQMNTISSNNHGLFLYSQGVKGCVATSTDSDTYARQQEHLANWEKKYTSVVAEKDSMRKSLRDEIDRNEDALQVMRKTVRSQEEQYDIELRKAGVTIRELRKVSYIYNHILMCIFMEFCTTTDSNVNEHEFTTIN